jgi:hypothetical protein
MLQLQVIYVTLRASLLWGFQITWRHYINRRVYFAQNAVQDDSVQWELSLLSQVSKLQIPNTSSCCRKFAGEFSTWSFVMSTGISHVFNHIIWTRCKLMARLALPGVFRPIIAYQHIWLLHCTVVIECNRCVAKICKWRVRIANERWEKGVRSGKGVE